MNARIASAVFGLAMIGGSLAADRVAILSEGAAASLWSPAPGVARVLPPYPANLADKSEDACVSLGYLLKEDGSTSDFAVLTSWGSKTTEGKAPAGHFDPYAQSASAAVKEWRFVPAGGGHANIKPIYTAATFAFSSNPATDLKPLRDHCVIADLPEFIKRAQEDAYKKGNLNKGQMQRDRTQNPPMIQPPPQR